MGGKDKRIAETLFPHLVNVSGPGRHFLVH